VVSSQTTRVVIASKATSSSTVVVAGQASRVRVVGSVGVESVGGLALGRGVRHSARGQLMSCRRGPSGGRWRGVVERAE